MIFFLVKYLGLLAMSKILQTNPKSIQAHNDLILRCLDDKDESIRLRALNLLSGMVWKLFYLFSNREKEKWIDVINFEDKYIFSWKTII